MWTFLVSIGLIVYFCVAAEQSFPAKVLSLSVNIALAVSYLYTALRNPGILPPSNDDEDPPENSEEDKP